MTHKQATLTSQPKFTTADNQGNIAAYVTHWEV